MNLLVKISLIAICFTGIVRAQVSHKIRQMDNIIHLKTFGEGDPILIINGGPGMSSDGFIALAKKFSKTHKAIIYDQRGTGKSKLGTVNASTITMDLMVDDIEAIRKNLKIDNFIVFGHSFGGVLASYYTSKYPQRVEKLVLSSSGGLDMELFNSLNIRAKLSAKTRDSLIYWNAKITAGDTTYRTRLKRGKYLAPAYLYDKSNVPIIAERLIQGNMLVNRLVYENMRRIGYDCKRDLQSFKKPVLIIQGRQDIIPIAISQNSANVFENSELIILDKCGHYGWLDQPEKYFEHIFNFLNN